MGLRFIELFAGIGGFRLGLERTGHTHAWGNEWLEKPRGTYKYNFGDELDGRDIKTVPASDVPDADLIVGGFPCATFSIAGKRAGFGFEDTRGTLCFEMFRIASERYIPYIFFENVDGILNSDKGRTYEVILCALDELGYDCQWEVIDSQNFGVPQHRERLYLIGNLRGKPRPKVFPITEDPRENDEENKGKPKEREGFFSDISPTLDAHYSKGGASRQYVNQEGVTQWRRGYFRDYRSGGVPTLTANMGTGGHNVPFLKVENDNEQGNVMTMISHTKANMKQRTQIRDATWTLDTAPQNKMVAHTSQGIRKLTPLECERLQGLPDNFTKYRLVGDKVVENADSERYERCGRTVSIPVIEAIGKKLGQDWYDE